MGHSSFQQQATGPGPECQWARGIQVPTGTGALRLALTRRLPGRARRRRPPPAVPDDSDRCARSLHDHAMDPSGPFPPSPITRRKAPARLRRAFQRVATNLKSRPVSLVGPGLLRASITSTLCVSCPSIIVKSCPIICDFLINTIFKTIRLGERSLDPK